jgi:exopolyphosphatase / guanosine-5'-triphosphate,3'-diphosphate pyrophosphatase
MVDSIYRFKTDSLENASIKQNTAYTLAAIDIGTNSVHMVVVKIDPKLATFTIIAREKDTVRLGDYDPKTGNLTEEAIVRAIAALQRCRELAVSFKVDRIVAVATSATREAANGQAFLDRIQDELGLAVDLISGAEEARRIYLGVLSGMDFNDRSHLIMDIGGGSTELVLADSQETRYLSSTKVGAVRLSKQFITTDPISPAEYQYLRSYIRGMLERPVENIRSQLKFNEKPCLVGTSGTIQTLAMMNIMAKQGVEPNSLNGYQISRQEVKEWLKRLSAMNYKERFDTPGVSDRRAEIILAGTLILHELMDLLNLNAVMVCERSLREGIIVDWMLTHGLIDDRLRYQSEIRERNVYKIAQKYQVDLEYSQRIANFAISIFDRTRGHLHRWDNQARELLWAAAILHNCGVYVSHSSHHKHSYYLIRNAELLGYTEVELELIANIARYHRKNKPKKKHDNYIKLPTKEYQSMVSQLSSILRLAVALDRRQIGAVKTVQCDYNSFKRELSLYIYPALANDDCALELWNLDYKKSVFEEEFNLKIIAKLERLGK